MWGAFAPWEATVRRSGGGAAHQIGFHCQPVHPGQHEGAHRLFLRRGAVALRPRQQSEEIEEVSLVLALKRASEILQSLLAARMRRDLAAGERGTEQSGDAHGGGR